MAEGSTKAFGRYLKTLRERRGLSLDDVASLSQTFPEKINKGYLSRCENGHQKLAFAKVIALSRIYEVPADVLVERMELDLELDRVGGPETEGMTYAELTDEGKKAFQEGFFFKAYGYLRDAVRRAGADPVKPAFRDADEQGVIGQMSCGTAALALGRHRYALHEFHFLESAEKFSPKFFPVLLERIAACLTALGDLERASAYAVMAGRKAEEHGDQEYLGYLYYTKARILMFQSDFKSAIVQFQKAHRAHRDAQQEIECALTLNSLAQCYFDTKRYAAARKAAEAAERLAAALGRPRTRALSLVLLGEIDEVEKRPGNAILRWKSAAEIAKKLNDRELRFKTEFVLFRRALKDGNEPAARAIRRRLRRLAPNVPGDLEELSAFQRLITEKLSASHDFVSTPQHASSSGRN